MEKKVQTGNPQGGASSNSAETKPEEEINHRQADVAYDYTPEMNRTSPLYKNYDKLSTTEYVSGLAEFIAHCETPMTIALQGDWGTGKTSFMNAIREELDVGSMEIKTTFFRTWEYSRLRNADEMYAAFGVHIVSELEETNGEKEGFLNRVKATLAESACARFVRWIMSKPKKPNAAGKEALRGFLMLLASSGTTFLRLKAGPVKPLFDGPIDTLESGLNRVTDAFLEREKETVQSISELKKNLAALVSGHGRVVIFVDDLDRLNPQTAVEFMELLKLFFDVPGCVFVLAVDYDVIASGLQGKFKDLTTEKGRSFFDKIIQLPFQMPVQNYDIENMFRWMFQKKGPTGDIAGDYTGAVIPPITEDYTDAVITLFTDTLGTNPRTMKRLYNAYELQALVYEKREDNQKLGPYESALLLISLILQLKRDGEYERLVNAKDAEDLKALLNPPDKNGEQNAEKLRKLEAQGELRKSISNALKAVADKESDVYEDFLQIAGELSTLTSVDATSQTRSSGISCIKLLGERLIQTPPVSAAKAMTITFQQILNSYLGKSPTEEQKQVVKKLITANPTFLCLGKEATDEKKGQFVTTRQLLLNGFSEAPNDPNAVYLATKNNTITKDGKGGKLHYVARLCKYMNDNKMTINGKPIEENSIYWDTGEKRMYCFPVSVGPLPRSTE